MAHWIIEDKGFGGLVFQCSNCGASWNDIFHSGIGCWDKCPNCHEDMDEEREYVEKKLVENPLATLRNIYENVAKATIAYQNMGDAIRRIDENVMTLEQVSGMSIENLIKLFSAGWTLKEPEVVTGLHTFEINESIAKEINDRIRRDGYLRAGEPVIREPLVVNIDFDEKMREQSDSMLSEEKPEESEE